MNKTKQQTHVIQQDILGTPGPNKNLYLVTWFHCANHGVYMVLADNEQEARDYQVFYSNKVTFLVVEIDRLNMPLVFEGESMKNEL